MFEPLVSLHSTEDREIGILAESFEISEDGKTFTFHLDPKARFSDGERLS
jgi:microcin C transport system substrate-binding protein